jgi:hypothetical protein
MIIGNAEVQEIMSNTNIFTDNSLIHLHFHIWKLFYNKLSVYHNKEQVLNENCGALKYEVLGNL